MDEFVVNRLLEEQLEGKYLFDISDGRIAKCVRNRRNLIPVEAIGWIDRNAVPDLTNWFAAHLPKVTISVGDQKFTRFNLIPGKGDQILKTGIWTVGCPFTIPENPVFNERIFVDVCGIKRFSTNSTYCARTFDSARDDEQIRFVRNYMIHNLLGFKIGPAYDHYFYDNGDLHLLFCGYISLENGDESTMVGTLYRNFFQFFVDAYLVIMLYSRWQVDFEADFNLMLRDIGIEKLMAQGETFLYELDYERENKVKE